MKEYLVEIGTEMKNTSEMQGRTESNLIDALSTAYDYEAKQSDIQDYLEREQNQVRSELSLIPSQNHLKVQRQVLQQRASARMENIFGKKRAQGSDKEQIASPDEVPEYLKRFRTKDSIPSFFRDADSLPDRLAVSDDRTPAARVVNQSYERQRKIDMKREQQNAIQKVANIQEVKQDMANGGHTDSNKDKEMTGIE